MRHSHASSHIDTHIQAAHWRTYTYEILPARKALLRRHYPNHYRRGANAASAGSNALLASLVAATRPARLVMCERRWATRHARPLPPKISSRRTNGWPASTDTGRSWPGASPAMRPSTIPSIGAPSIRLVRGIRQCACSLRFPVETAMYCLGARV